MELLIVPMGEIFLGHLHGHGFGRFGVHDYSGESGFGARPRIDLGSMS
jgi:hypothetical protein